MTETLVNLRDIRFVLYEMLDVEKLTRYEYFADHSRDTFDIAIDAAYKMAREVFWPAYTDMDKEGVTLDQATGATSVPRSMHKVWETCVEGGWHGLTAPGEVGGQQYPDTVATAINFILNAGNTAAHMYYAGAIGAAGLIRSFGSDKLKKIYLEKLYSGEWAGTMCITEPQAGSSLADVKTTAVKAEDGDHYLITGTKCFISNGDHDLTENIINPVLARLPDAPPGVKGISLFLVPKYRVNEDGSKGEFNDVLTAGLEHKLGLRGNATATLNFGENSGCWGWLVGEPNQGLKYMFQLMNHARIATGVQATGVASNGYQHALQYAKERLQGRPIAERDLSKPQVPIIKHADVRRMLLTQKATVEGNFALLAYAGFLGDQELHNPVAEQRQNAALLLGVLTPLCKAYGSESSFQSLIQSLQCYGGYGFSEEFPIAQMLRDTKVFSIYEGTNAIQSMDLLGRKVVMQGGAALQLMMSEIGKTVEAASGLEGLKEMASKLDAAAKAVAETTAKLGEIAMKGDAECYVSSAVPYLQMFSLTAVAWLFLWQAVVAQRALDKSPGEADRNFYQGKVATARFYINNRLPEVHTTAEILEGGERTALDFAEEWF